MRLAELFAELDGGRAPTEKASPETICAALREVASRYARPNPFKPGDLITPCAAGDVKGAGEPHIVLEFRERPDPDFTAKSASETVSNAYGRRPDIRVASVSRGDVVPFWVESWQFEVYAGPGSEAPVA